MAILPNGETAGAAVSCTRLHAERTRQRLFSQIRALTAQSRMSGMVVGLLPIVVLGMFGIVQPTYTEMLFFDPTGKLILKVALGLDLGAFLLIRQLLKVKF